MSEYTPSKSIKNLKDFHFLLQQLTLYYNLNSARNLFKQSFKGVNQATYLSILPDIIPQFRQVLNFPQFGFWLTGYEQNSQEALIQILYVLSLQVRFSEI